MKRRGSLFFIGLISAIATIISLNVAFGRSGFYNDRYPYHNHYYHHRCYDRNDRDRYERDHENQHQQSDSTHSNY